MFLISALVAGLFLPVAYTCSLPTGTFFYTPIQRTILAPIVFQAKVLNTTTYLDRHATGQVFDACVRIAKIFKAPFEIPPELCFGSFGIEELCLTYVFEGSDYIFFVNEDFTARYDGFPLSAISVTDDNLSSVERGYCSADQSDDCEPPKIDLETFEPVNRILEGRNAVVKCQASGTLPKVTIWSRGGQLVMEKLRGNMLEISDATMYDTGRYSCTVKNPAGEDTAETYVQILSSACGGLVAVHENKTITIQSPDFPWPYRKAKSCSWRVCPPQGMKLEFNFTTFDLRTFDKLEIINECDRQHSPWRTYCGSKVSPGSFLSRCNSTCMQIVLNSGFPPNRVATGFQANIKTSDPDETEDNLEEMVCGSNLVARVIPSERQLLALEVNVKILEVHRQDEPMLVSPDDEISIKHDFTITDMYGCPMELKTGSEYYIFASFERHINSEDPISLVMDFAVDPNNNETSADFIQRLKAIKEEPPQCEPLPAK